VEPHGGGPQLVEPSAAARVRRFLVTGAETGPYRGCGPAIEHAPAVVLAARECGTWLVQQAVAVVAEDRAARVAPAVWAVALASALADDAGRRAAGEALALVCPTAERLFLFVRYVEQLRGWGRGLRRAVARWYLERDVEALAREAVVHRERDGWTHRDLLRLAHPVAHEPARRALFAWITHGTVADVLPAPARAYAAALAVDDTAAWAHLPGDLGCAPEVLPAWTLRRPEVWRALLEAGLPPATLLPRLRELTELGVLSGSTLALVVAQLEDPAWPARTDTHPVEILAALRSYTAAPWSPSSRPPPPWTPLDAVVDALRAAFDASFWTVEPAGKRTLVALDVSGSMGRRRLETAVAMALALLVAEPACEIVAYAGAPTREAAERPLDRGWLVPLTIGFGWRLDEAVDAISGLPFAPPDYARPMTWALERGREVDTFVIVTDDETRAGSRPGPALRRYRDETGIDARLVVVRLDRSYEPVPDAGDPLVLDVDGYDAAVPRLITDFARGAF
jgi:60 kDa SS-A/Ro ribonucleoprotein